MPSGRSDSYELLADCHNPELLGGPRSTLRTIYGSRVVAAIADDMWTVITLILSIGGGSEPVYIKAVATPSCYPARQGTARSRRPPVSY